jgi:hypothetical protein
MNALFNPLSWLGWGNVSVKKRLLEMKTHLAHRKNEHHTDFLNKVQEENQSDHIHRMEYHGSQFWTKYFEDESPRGVVQDEPLPRHHYGDQQSMEALLLKPDSESCMIPTREKPRLGRLAEIASESEWLDHIRVAEAAFERKDFPESERNFRIALNECKRSSSGDLRLYRTLIGLSHALALQGKRAEAEALRLRAASIEESIE